MSDESISVGLTAHTGQFEQGMTRSVRSLDDAAAASARAQSAFDRMRLPLLGAMPTADKVRSGLGSVAKGAAAEAVAGRIAPAAVGAAGGFGLAKGAVDKLSGKAAEVSIGVAHGFLKSQLAIAEGAVKFAVKGMARVAVLPFTITSIAFKAGIIAAESLLFVKIKQMTGASTVQMVLGYAAFKVSLKIATTLLKTAVGTMVGVAVFPIKVALGALRTGLKVATGLVKGAAREMAGIARIPLKLAGDAAGFGLAGIGLGGLIGLPAVIGASVLAASNLEETASKVGVVFGKSAGLVTRGADEMAAKFGVVKNEFLEGAAGLGAVGKAAGLAQADAAALGVRFARVAADTASLHNLGFGESLEKIRSGLVGEAEPLRSLGVLLSENAVKAQALAMGFRAVDGQFAEGQKVMARAELIVRGLADAGGDLERTSSSLANRLRELWGRAQNLGATLGAYLLPAVKSLASTFADLAKGIEGAVTSRASVFEGWAKSLKNVADWAGIAYRNLDDFKKLGPLLFADAGKFLLESLKPVFEYTLNYAEYFGKVLGREVEKAIRNALHIAHVEQTGKAVAGVATGVAMTVPGVSALFPAKTFAALSNASQGAWKAGKFSAEASVAMALAAKRATVFAAEAAVAVGKRGLGGVFAAMSSFASNAAGGPAMFGAKLGLAMGARASAMVPGANGPAEEPLKPPEFHRPQFQADPKIGNLINGMFTAEKFAALSMAAKEAGRNVADLAGKGLSWLADRSKAAKARMDAPPQGSSTARDLMAALGDRPEAKRAMSRAARGVAPLNAGLGGGGFGVGGALSATLAAEIGRGVAVGVEKKGKGAAEGPAGASSPLTAIEAAQAINAMVAGHVAGAVGGGPAAVAASVAVTAAAAKAPKVDPRLAGALEKNSREAYSAVAKAASRTGDKSDLKDVAKSGREGVGVQKQILASLNRMSGVGAGSTDTYSFGVA